MFYIGKDASIVLFICVFLFSELKLLFTIMHKRNPSPALIYTIYKSTHKRYTVIGVAGVLTSGHLHIHLNPYKNIVKRYHVISFPFHNE